MNFRLRYARALARELFVADKVWKTTVRIVVFAGTLLGIPLTAGYRLPWQPPIAAVIAVLIIVPFVAWTAARVWDRVTAEMNTPQVAIPDDLEPTSRRGMFLLRLTNHGAIAAYPMIHADMFDPNGRRIDPHLPVQIQTGEVLPYGGHLSIRILTGVDPNDGRVTLMTDGHAGKGIELRDPRQVRLELAIRLTRETPPVTRRYLLNVGPDGLEVNPLR